MLKLAYLTLFFNYCSTTCISSRLAKPFYKRQTLSASILCWIWNLLCTIRSSSFRNTILSGWLDVSPSLELIFSSNIYVSYDTYNLHFRRVSSMPLNKVIDYFLISWNLLYSSSLSLNAVISISSQPNYSEYSIFSLIAMIWVTVCIRSINKFLKASWPSFMKSSICPVIISRCELYSWVFLASFSTLASRPYL